MRDTSHPNLRFASLDMRGNLVFDVPGAIRAGVWADEIAAAKMLGRAIKAARKAHEPIPYVLTDAGRAHLEGKK